MNKFIKMPIIFCFAILFLIIKSPLFAQDFSCIKLLSVTFHSNYDIVQDDDKTKEYSAKEQWLDNNLNGSAEDPGDHKYPICYSDDSKMKIEAVFKIDPATSVPSFFQSKMKIKGVCVGGGLTFRLDSQDVRISGDQIRFSSTKTRQALPEKIQFYDPLVITWSVSIDDGNKWSPIGKSKNRVYVTLGRPSPTYLFYSVVHLACSNAVGLTKKDKDAIVEKAYSNFTSQSVKTVDGVPLQYWGSISCVNGNDPSFFTTWGLLKNKDGRCGSFQELFMDILRVNNISSDPYQVKSNPFEITSSMKKRIDAYLTKNGLIPKDYNKGERCQFYVKKWNLPGPDTVGIDLWGVAGQGNPDPISNFSDHALVKYNNLYYDPSYGTNPCKDLDWEKASLDGFGILVINSKDKNKYFWWIDKKKDQTKVELSWNAITRTK